MTGIGVIILITQIPPALGFYAGENEAVIERGKDPNRPLLSGMFGSFADAPDGFSEEMQEIMIAAGWVITVM